MNAPHIELLETDLLAWVQALPPTRNTDGTVVRRPAAATPVAREVDGWAVTFKKLPNGRILCAGRRGSRVVTATLEADEAESWKPVWR